MTSTTSAGTVHESAASTAPVLSVEDLSVELYTEHGRARVVDGVTFGIASGETFALVGESGSGKSMTALAILGLIGPRMGTISSGAVRFGGRDLTALSESELRSVRGPGIGMIFQEPRRNLDPAFTVGDQIAATIRAHGGTSRKEAWRTAVELLDRVGIADAPRRAREYVHQFSGGMAQRAMLAVALSCSPGVLIADEPTTALDVTVQAQVLDLIRELQRDLGLAVLFITHDLGVVAEMADRVAVMYAGQLVEEADVVDLYVHPQHPYSSALLASSITAGQAGSRLAVIAGTVPPVRDWAQGCRFHSRCDHADERCVGVAPPITPGPGGSTVRCHRSAEISLPGIG